MEAKLPPTQDERIMAALIHVAVLLPLWGLILSGIIWATQREKSEYVRRQGVQALAWQAAQVVLMMIGMGCYFVSFFFGFGMMLLTTATDSPPLFLPVLPLLSFALIFFVSLLFFIVGVIAAIQSLQGRDFVYPFLGPSAQAYLIGSTKSI